MCPSAFGSGGKKYWLKDHDTALTEDTAVQNTWFTVLDEEDVRLIYHSVEYDDEEHNMPTIQVRWTLDGNVYIGDGSDEAAGSQWYFYRNKYATSEASNELIGQLTRILCMYDVPKHALHAKLEARVTNAVGTTPVLRQRCLYETLEET